MEIKTIKPNLSYQIKIAPQWFLEGTKFLLIGIFNTILDIGVYLILAHWVGIAPNWKVIAKGISYVAGIINSFFWNKKWTFKARDISWRKLFPFTTVNLVALTINAGIMAWSTSILKLPEIISLMMATGTTFLWNFTLSKWFIFKTSNRVER